jgi:hypothetical protein
MPDSSGTAASTLPSNAGPSSSNISRSVRRSSPACSNTKGLKFPLSLPRLNGFSSSSTLPNRYDCQASGNRRSPSRASPSHNRPKTVATATASGRSSSSSSTRYRKSRATAESTTPRNTPSPRALTGSAVTCPMKGHVSTLRPSGFACRHARARALAPQQRFGPNSPRFRLLTLEPRPASHEVPMRAAVRLTRMA